MRVRDTRADRLLRPADALTSGGDRRCASRGVGLRGRAPQSLDKPEPNGETVRTSSAASIIGHRTKLNALSQADRRLLLQVRHRARIAG